MAVSNRASLSCKISFTVHHGLAPYIKHIHTLGVTSSGSQSCKQKPPPVGGWNCINKYLGITIFGGSTWCIYISLLSAAQWWAFIRISTIFANFTTFSNEASPVPRPNLHYMLNEWMNFTALLRMVQFKCSFLLNLCLKTRSSNTMKCPVETPSYTKPHIIIADPGNIDFTYSVATSAWL